MTPLARTLMSMLAVVVAVISARIFEQSVGEIWIPFWGDLSGYIHLAIMISVLGLYLRLRLAFFPGATAPASR